METGISCSKPGKNKIFLKDLNLKTLILEIFGLLFKNIYFKVQQFYDFLIHKLHQQFSKTVTKDSKNKKFVLLSIFVFSLSNK